MAIYVLLQCCKCNTKKRLHLYSSSPNKYDIHSQLCEHFNIIYSYTCKFGFFTLGWRIFLEVKVQCKKCNSKYFNFGSITFNSDYYSYQNTYICCHNVFSISVDGYKYFSDGNALSLQEEQKKLEEKYKKEKEEKMHEEEKRKREEKEKLEKQQEFKRKEEERQRIILKEKEKIKKIMEKQKEEEKKLDQLYNFETNYLDSKLNQLLIKIDKEINNELIFDIEENLNKKFDLEYNNFEFH